MNGRRLPRLARRVSFVFLANVFWLCGGIQAQETANFNIPPQSLIEALVAFGDQSGRDVLAGKAVNSELQTQGYSGESDPETALKAILRGTGLTYRRDGNVFVIVKPPQESSSAKRSQARAVVEEITVTARKREESVQDVPIAISAFSAETMKEMGLRNLADFEGVVPGLNLGGGGNGVKPDSNPFIRGVGQRETKVTLDPAVGTYIDGIYIGRTSGALLDSVGVERVEVLRGPQGTLFGKNTTGGAISVTTKKPHAEFGGELSGNFGNYGRRDGSLALNIPLVPETLLSRITVASVKNDGYFQNVVDGERWSDDDRLTGIVQLRWLPSEDWVVDLLAERTKIRQTPRAQHCQFIRESGFETGQTSIYNTVAELSDQLTFEEACRKSNALPPGKFASDYTADSFLRKAVYHVDTSTVGLTADWSIGNVGAISNLAAKSITAWRRTDLLADEDLDGTEAVALMRIASMPAETDQYSQEFQLTGFLFDDRLFFSTGLYYFEEETPQDELYLSASLITLGPGQNPFAPPGNTNSATLFLEPARELKQTDNQAYAWYGQINFDITNNLQMTAGVRYTRETRWSRYSKSYVVLESAVEGFVSSGALGPLQYVESSGPIRPFEDWVYNPYVPEEGEVTHEAWTPTVSLKYHWHDHIAQSLGLDEAMSYITYSEGFSSGGVDQGAVDSDGNGTPEVVEFEPAEVKNIEVGLKFSGWDSRMQANLSAYYMDYTDMQLTSVRMLFGVPQPFIDNVGKSSIQGLEGEVVFLPSANWQIMLNAAYTEAEIKEWNSRVINGSTQTIQDRSDEPLPRVPEWQAFLMSSYTFNLPDDSTLTPSISLRYVDEIYHGFDRGSFIYGEDAVTSDATTFVDARLAWLSPDARMEVALWGKNLTNEDDYLVGGIPLTDVNGATGKVYGNPKTYGLEFTYRFGAE